MKRELKIRKESLNYMATNFRIFIYRNSDNLHLQLIGDFDGSSAYAVINALKENAKGIRHIFIHTGGLAHIHPFGRGVFEKESHNLKRRFIDVVFTGENAKQIAV
jgi:hypothetical protein